MKFNVHLNIFNLPTKAIGLQLGDVGLNAIELMLGGPKAVVEAASEIILPKGVIRDDVIVEPSLLAKHIEQLIEHPKFGKFSTNNVVVNLPESKCFVRVINMQKMSDAEIDNAIPFEAENYIPIPVDQVYLDWQKISETDSKIEILIVASAKEYVDKVVKSLEEAHLVPVALEVESQSLVRLLMDQNTSGSVMIANIQTSRTDLVMVERGNIQFTSTIPLGGNAFTESIARGLGIQAAAAETIKQQVGIANTTEYPNLKTIMLPVLNNFVAEIKNIFAFHDQHSSEKVHNLILAGGGALLQHIDELLLEELSSQGVGVTKADPAQKIEIKNQNEPIPLLAYSTACGLALRPIE